MARYPSPLFQILCILQIVASGIIVVFFYVAWADIAKTVVLKDDLGLVEKTKNPNEWHAPWYFKLLHGTAHLSLLSAIVLFALHAFKKLYPPFGLVLNFCLTFLYIAGVAGVAAFSFALGLVGKCDSGMGCIAYKVAFFTAHVSGLLAWAMMLLDAYTFGQTRSQTAGYQKFNEDSAGLLPLRSKGMVATAYEPTRS
ncbi:uncharacterized protein BDZ99DRAFT_499210 [Mytilinidion resinicola]|uniref:Uncharacterized protein n=1 Tax=Mytilinidion resinicola TaxID=574789 RepID=A0A6A6YLG7_9PEZI|nr:uncharacterized protein BDZ99DRAFT_499210 [Mytilinidion resinicola]KAF2808825.1 hypothetical protein BDZ99DRAFT_499210 [Mytilinidion resinicola]